VVDRLEEMLADEPSMNSVGLAALLAKERGLLVHPRSVERALARRRKKGPYPSA